MSVLLLTESEAKASSGSLCWRSGTVRTGALRRRNLACSKSFDHFPGSECRFDMDITVPTWTPTRVRLALITAAVSATASAAIGFVGAAVLR